MSAPRNFGVRFRSHHPSHIYDPVKGLKSIAYGMPGDPPEPTPAHGVALESHQTGRGLGELTWTWTCRCGASGQARSKQRAGWAANAHEREAA